MTQGIACRTWDALWADEYMQYSYDRGVFEGAAILHGLIGMGLAIDGRTWHCSHNLNDDPDHPEGLGGCRGQTFVPIDRDAPWPGCWMCGSEG